MRSTEPKNEWDRPRHTDIREAITVLGDNGLEEIREALHGGFEPFESQMHRRMKTRRPELRGAYKTLRNAGSDKVYRHLAAIDLEGLAGQTPRRDRPTFDRSRLKRRKARSSSSSSKTPVAIS